MISKNSDKVINTLYNILDDLNSIKSPSITFENCVKNKLNNAHNVYDSEITRIYNYVLTRSNIKVLKALAKIQKSKED